MELGEFRVYFVQYKSSAGHWHTRQKAFSNYEDAVTAAIEYENIYLCKVRVVNQTTTNVVEWIHA